jgi:hypothetical protein
MNCVVPEHRERPREAATNDWSVGWSEDVEMPRLGWSGATDCGRGSAKYLHTVKRERSFETTTDDWSDSRFENRPSTHATDFARPDDPVSSYGTVWGKKATLRR